MVQQYFLLPDVYSFFLNFGSILSIDAGRSVQQFYLFSGGIHCPSRLVLTLTLAI
jgi:hypothetical protein